MSITINGSGTITGISVGGLPDGVIATDDIAAAAITPAKLSQPFSSGTAVASTSGTAIDFTGIPNWVKRITVMFDGVSFNAAAAMVVQIGDSGGVETTGYNSTCSNLSGTVSSNSSTAGYIVFTAGSAVAAVAGFYTLSLISGNKWVGNGTVGRTDGGATHLGGGVKTLSDVLTSVRITTDTGTPTFDGGSINILMEG